MPLLNSIKKHLKTLLFDKITVEGKKVAYYEGFAPEKAVNSNLIFTAGNIAIERGAYDSKTAKGYRLTIPIYCNYRGEKSLMLGLPNLATNIRVSTFAKVVSTDEITWRYMRFTIGTITPKFERFGTYYELICSSQDAT